METIVYYPDAPKLEILGSDGIKKSFFITADTLIEVLENPQKFGKELSDLKEKHQLTELLINRYRLLNYKKPKMSFCDKSDAVGMYLLPKLYIMPLNKRKFSFSWDSIEKAAWYLFLFLMAGILILLLVYVFVLVCPDCTSIQIRH